MSGPASGAAGGNLRVGLLGVDTSHAGAYARILNDQAAIPGARITWVWGGVVRADQPDARTLAATYAIDRVIAEPTELLHQTDLVLVVDDAGHGRHHVPQARAFVAAGVPAFLDKPMTPDLGEARTLFRLAAERGVPVTSSSALRYARELAEDAAYVADLGEPSSVVSVGPGEWFHYGVHAVEQVYAVLGPGVQWVQRASWPERDVAVLGYGPGGPTAVVQVLRDATCGFHLTLHARKGRHSITIEDADAYYTAQLRAVVEMVRTGVPPVAPAETLEILAVLRAGELSAAADGARVHLADVLA
ncbi:Gfo/Idh/MocA family protein [Actinopolymorpha rutila]|uniref:Putative dehydrogenase n=1 Tax=Actinopolymorpha rutila TaxID=446787 RepID=A0A852ZR33_9ACTN|nr:Gfo/Idh/MocA family oxidoreductase [Actinopolymorpha rutila]NYH91026.1 putative dehydrogenase [Actinopolymorpha rutila]